jgi:PAS domain S-box-containing protein
MTGEGTKPGVPTKQSSSWLGGPKAGKSRRQEKRPRVLVLEEATSHEILSALVKHAPVGLMVLRGEGALDARSFKIVSVNPAVFEISRMRDIAESDLVGKPIDKVFPGLCNKELAASFLSGIRSGRPKHLGEIHYGDARIPEGIFSIQAFPIPNRGVGIVLEKVTERPRPEEALQVREAKHQSFLEAAPDAMVISDEEGRILLVNSQTERLFGYARERLLHQPVEMLMPERFRAGHANHRREYVTKPHTRLIGAGLELVGLRADGSEFPAEISLSALQSDVGLLICSAIRDVTERKKSENVLKETAAELARSNAELEQFAYAASHDLQEPLRTIIGATQVLAQDYGEKLVTEARQWLEFATDGAKRMQELLNALLDYARVSAPRRFELVDCEKVYAAAISNLGIAIAESGATITHGPLPMVMGDGIQLIQLLQNLLANAIRFRCQEPLKVHVSAQQQENEWRVAVRDNGIGIDPRHFRNLFALFQRLQPHTALHPSGTGIGLAICKKIVERHGGHIGVDSTPREGSTFYFTIPKVDAQSLPASVFAVAQNV